MQRPYKAPGFGWILAALVLIVVVLALLNIIVISETFFWAYSGPSPSPSCSSWARPRHHLPPRTRPLRSLVGGFQPIPPLASLCSSSSYSGAAGWARLDAAGSEVDNLLGGPDPVNGEGRFIVVTRLHRAIWKMLSQLRRGAGVQQEDP